MIELVEGDFFDYPAEIRVNTVNCVGVMGAGVALAFKQRYPDMFKEYFKVCKNKDISPSRPHVWENHILFEDSLNENITIINFPTKIHWRNNSEYKYIDDGLSWLKNFLKDKEGNTVTLPALGCGHGGLEWDKVKGMIFSYLEDSPAKILVFEPKSSKEAGSNHVQKKSLILEKKIKSFLPSDKNFPLRLLGKIDKETYFRGELEIINNSTLGIITSSKDDIKELETIKNILGSLSKEKVPLSLVLNGSNKLALKTAENALKCNINVILTLGSGIADIDTIFEPYIKLKKLLLVSTGALSKRFSRREFFEANFNTAYLSDAMLIVSKNISWMKKNILKWQQACPKYFAINYQELFVDYDQTINELSSEKINKNKESLRANLNPIKLHFGYK